MHIPSILTYLYPESESRRDWEVHDAGDGPYIGAWRLPDLQPSEDELRTVWESPEFRAWYQARQAEYTDAKTAQAIRARIHPHAPVDEQFAILREQLAQVLADFGRQPTERFQVLSDIAEAEIAKGQKKKDALGV